MTSDLEQSRQTSLPDIETPLYLINHHLVKLY